MIFECHLFLNYLIRPHYLYQIVVAQMQIRDSLFICFIVAKVATFNNIFNYILISRCSVMYKWAWFLEFARLQLDSSQAIWYVSFRGRSC